MKNDKTVRRWQRGEKKLNAAIKALGDQRGALLERADRVGDHNERKRIWQHAQRLEDRISSLKGRLARLLAHKDAENQPSLFDRANQG